MTLIEISFFDITRRVLRELWDTAKEAETDRYKDAVIDKTVKQIDIMAREEYGHPELRNIVLIDKNTEHRSHEEPHTLFFAFFIDSEGRYNFLGKFGVDGAGADDDTCKQHVLETCILNRARQLENAELML